MANVDGITQIEMRDDRGGVRGVVVHVVTIADLARPAMAAPVMRNDAIAHLQEVEHLGVPVVGAERPAMMEDDGLRVPGTPVLVVDRRGPSFTEIVLTCVPPLVIGLSPNSLVTRPSSCAY